MYSEMSPVRLELTTFRLKATALTIMLRRLFILLFMGFFVHELTTFSKSPLTYGRLFILVFVGFFVMARKGRIGETFSERLQILTDMPAF